MGIAGMGAQFESAVSMLHSRAGSRGVGEVQRLIHQARYGLRLKTVGPISSAIGAGAVFDYFDEVRQIIETASSDLLFVDPYLDAEFVSRYLPHVRADVAIRLLTRKGLDQLMPAVQAFSTQSGHVIHVRSSADMHDRFVIVNGRAAYQSGASFKDGAKRAPTTLTQVTDAFADVQRQYEDRWRSGTVHL
jgi:hypothetical protein